MTDRAQPGAIDSLVRNYELGDALGQFSDGWVVPADEPTASAQRSDLDETAFTAFDQSSSSSSLTVTIGPGEAFVDGWLATDTSTDVGLAASTAGQTVGVSWDPDAVYDPETNADRDAADRVVIALESDVSGVDPFLPLWTFDTDGSGVTGVVDERPVGVTVGPAAFEDEAGNVVTDLVGENLRLVDGELRGTVGIDTRAAVNGLFIQNAEQDFELGLNLLEYDDGQYEVFANDNRIRSASNGVDLQLGSPLNDLGYAALGTAADLSAGISTEQGEFTGHTAEVYDVFITNTYGYSGGFDNTVRQWDPDTMGGTGNTFTGHNDGVYSVFVTDTNGYSGDLDGVIKQWDPDTLNGTGNEFSGHTDDVKDIYVGDTYGFSASQDGTVKQWDPDTMSGTGNEFTGHGDGNVEAVSVVGSYGYSCDGFGADAVLKWDAETMDGTGDEFTGHDGPPSAVFATDSYVYTGDENGNMYQLDPSTLDATGNEFTGHSFEITSLYVTDSFGYSTSSKARFDDEGGTVKQWDPDTLNGTGSGFTAHTGFPQSAIIGGAFGYSAGAGADGDDAVRKWADNKEVLNGSVAHTFQDLGFVPEEAVINDDLRQPLPTNADVYYQIEDADGNSQTIQRSDIDSTVDLTGFTSSEVSTTAFIERDDTTVESPQLDAWALYLRGA